MQTFTSPRGPTQISVHSPLNLSRERDLQHPQATKNAELRAKYEDLLTKGKEAKEVAEIEKLLNSLRKLVLLEGLPTDASSDGDNLRGRVWKVLLRVKNVSADNYVALVNKGQVETRLYDKIRNDTFRTFKTNVAYNKKVPENTLIRLLNAFIHSCDKHSNISYVQGMNVICAVFLYIMNELDAFYCFSQFVKFHVPLYFHPGIEGAFEGVKLVDEVMKIVDPELYLHLISKEHKADVYAMGPVLSFGACTPPLEELLKLWDLFIAFGAHLNIVCVVAQIVIGREEILAAERPNLRTLPPLEANVIISVAIQLLRQLPDDLYKRLMQHPWKAKKSSRKFNTLPRNFKGKGKFPDMDALF
eukprot:TRINITY_DN8791_c0_g1_i1.p1 TRINITY_DN8791_c0_g1~~TRINITY_DN8791_c0_g1_i1.p1  ORF type:complete len:359 (+),score=111.25 TRINITY_DN8791_c0_g1_i1:84-1160(+)